MARRRSPVEEIARERSLILYSLAVQRAREGDYERARRYIARGRSILLRARARRPAHYRRWVCRRCLVPLIPGVTARVRVRGTRSYILVVKRCLLCGWIQRTAASKRR